MIDKLSDMERKVMAAIAGGYSQREVAEQMSRSPNTIATHMARVCVKLEARSPLHAILIFHRHQVRTELLAEMGRR